MSVTKGGDTSKKSKGSNDRLSAIDMEFQAYISEYEALQSQTEVHISNQQQITNLAMLFIGGLIALAQIADSLSKQREIQPLLSEIAHPILLIVAFIFAAFFHMQLWHDIHVAYIWGYIESILKPRIKLIFTELNWENTEVFSWQGRFVAVQKRKPLDYLIGVARYVLTFLPTPVLMTIYILSLQSRIPIESWEWIFFAFASFGLIASVVSAIYTVTLYFGRIPDFQESA